MASNALVVSLNSEGSSPATASRPSGACRWPSYHQIGMPSSGTTFGARSRHLAATRSCQTLGCSMMWSSTDTTLASAGSGIGAPSGANGLVGQVDPQAQQREAVGLALRVAAQAHGDAATEGAVQHE